MDTHYQVVYRDLVQLCDNSLSHKSNLLLSERLDLKVLETNPHIIIKQADKRVALLFKIRLNISMSHVGSIWRSKMWFLVSLEMEF